MKMHVLLRGQSFIDDNSPWKHKFYKRNFLYLIENFKYFFLDPLRATYDVELYVVTWESPIEHVFKNFSSNVLIFPNSLFGQNGYKQFDMVAKGLDLISSNEGDLILIIRLDTIFKKAITDWFDLNSNFDIVLPWKESGADFWQRYYMRWKDRWSQHRVGDIFYFLKNKSDIVYKFKNTILRDPEDGHEIYDELLANNLNVKFCLEGYYDSDTSKMTKEAENPLFLLQRPYHHELDEFSLKLIDASGEPLYGF